MNKAWNFAVKHLFCDKTDLFYDHLYDLSRDGAIKGLPNLEQIKAQFPNPNGWSTGMEDSVICGSMMLDCAMKKGENEFAKRIAKGLINCATVSDEPGFIARSISPIDEKSHYSNSSRDQYTHFIYSLTYYYFSPICTAEHKQKIKAIFVSVANRMEKYVVLENDYEFPREDGKKGLCFKMWGEIGKHEYLRLPFIYLATFVVTGDKNYKELYLKYRDEAIEKSFGLDYEQIETAYPISQMQYSLKFICDFDESVKDKCKELMSVAQKTFAKKAFDYFDELQTCTETLCYKYTPFDEQEPVYIGNIGGIEYYNHNQDIYPQNKAYYILRNIGDSVAIVALDGEYDESLLELLKASANLIDYSNHYSNAPIYLLNGYYSMIK